MESPSNMFLNVNEIESLTQVSHETEEQVVIVNEHDVAIGATDKTKAHLLGVLHRAFSIFVMNGEGQLLLQRRAIAKYHSRGLWSNTCCGHPRPGESIEKASRRRLKEEMGFEADLKSVFRFRYRANLENGLIENEYDHVLVGFFDGVPEPNPAEVADYSWMDPVTLSLDLKAHPKSYTYWFRISLDRFLRAIEPARSK